MAYEHTVVTPFAMPGGRSYEIGQKITDPAEADAVYARNLGRNLSRHEATTPDEPPEVEQPSDPAPEPKPQPGAKAASAPAAPVPASPSAAS